MSMDDRFELSTLYRLARESNGAKNDVERLIDRKIDKLEKDKKDLLELLKYYKELKEEISCIKEIL
jgi:hypothetical protein